MERDQAVDIVAKIAANFPWLSGQASSTGADWVVEVVTPAGYVMTARTVEQARAIWRDLKTLNRTTSSAPEPARQTSLLLDQGGDAR